MRWACPMAWCARCRRFSASVTRPRSRGCPPVCPVMYAVLPRYWASIRPLYGRGGGKLFPLDTSLLRVHLTARPLDVATQLAEKSGTTTLSRARNVRYSIVVRTTETELLVDQDDSDQRIIQRVLAG